MRTTTNRFGSYSDSGSDRFMSELFLTSQTKKNNKCLRDRKCIRQSYDDTIPIARLYTTTTVSNNIIIDIISFIKELQKCLLIVEKMLFSSR